jgi:two-component system, chemotaxis family, protein-glutamate methylesterase/glutaminase
MPIRVLIVDDSPTIRALIKRALRADNEIIVVGEAGDPYEAREAIKALSPDVVTLDVEMPKMTGIEFLEKIMRLRPTPVIMVSTLTHAGADKAVEALAMGAVACIGKPASIAAENAFHELPEMIREAAAAKVDNMSALPVPAVQREKFEPNGRTVVIGSSTGGVEALMQIITAFPKNCPPTLITQHMPSGFTRSFAARLNQNSAATVAEATDGAPLETGKIYLAPGGSSHLTISGRHRKTCSLTPGPLISGHCPSVDELFHSASALGDQAVGVILTGMGRDGADGMLAMRKSGAATIGQNKQSCVVYGMPKVAFELGGVQQQLPLSGIANAILEKCEAR